MMAAPVKIAEENEGANIPHSGIDIISSSRFLQAVDAKEQNNNLRDDHAL
jgi:hypothetical protein